MNNKRKMKKKKKKIAKPWNQLRWPSTDEGTKKILYMYVYMDM
jgi:hypothetical protein